MNRKKERMMGKGGRPPKFEDWMCDKLIELGKLGKGVHKMCAEIGICEQTWHNWRNKDYPTYNEAFLEASTRAKQLSQAWWEEKAQECLFDEVDPKERHKRLNSRILELNLMNRIGYGKKTEETGQPISITISKDLADDVG